MQVYKTLWLEHKGNRDTEIAHKSVTLNRDKIIIQALVLSKKL